jgi:predicted DNA-binding transcriptional regulator AlpA
MTQSILQEMNELFQGRAFLSVEDITQLLNCSEQVIYNWTKRADPKKRPPRVIVGKSIRFPKRDFARWLVEEQGVSA